jgi:hypothetical protein
VVLPTAASKLTAALANGDLSGLNMTRYALTADGDVSGVAEMPPIPT